MGYTIKIGNAKPDFSKEDGRLSARWVVENANNENAPTFPNDEMTGNSNTRSPSYSAWYNFCKDAGIYDHFYDDRGWLIGGHPGCILITEEHLKIVGDARATRESMVTKPAGFCGFPVMNQETEKWEYPDDGKYDATLARLIWLDWWLKWAFANCETPAIENY